MCCVDAVDLAGSFGEMQPLIDKGLEDDVSLRQQIAHFAIPQGSIGIDRTKVGVQVFFQDRFNNSAIITSASPSSSCLKMVTLSG
jgi:hypothetical protein